LAWGGERRSARGSRPDRAIVGGLVEREGELTGRDSSMRLSHGGCGGVSDQEGPQAGDQEVVVSRRRADTSAPSVNVTPGEELGRVGTNE
jgi:hypothetical protein